MRGVAKQHKMSAAFGQAWCDKGFHFTAMEDGQYITYGGRFEDGAWPKPCRICVDMYELDKLLKAARSRLLIDQVA